MSLWSDLPKASVFLYCIAEQTRFPLVGSCRGSPEFEKIKLPGTVTHFLWSHISILIARLILQQDCYLWWMVLYLLSVMERRASKHFDIHSSDKISNSFNVSKKWRFVQSVTSICLNDLFSITFVIQTTQVRSQMILWNVPQAFDTYYTFIQWSAWYEIQLQWQACAHEAI